MALAHAGRCGDAGPRERDGGGRHEGETMSVRLAAKTANLKPKNPHDSPHYGKQHAKSENDCAQCHKFGFKVP